jgi:2,4-diketo-3-deoxy-L-fuconate hydrolase
MASSHLGEHVKWCRFDGDRLGLVEGDVVRDVTYTLKNLPPITWPPPPGDPIVTHLDVLGKAAATGGGDLRPLSSVRLSSIVTTPTKVMAAPANFRAHVELDTLDPGVDQGVHRAQVLHLTAPTEDLGLFLKASSSLVGPAEGVRISTGMRTDYEVELAVVIGRTARNVSAERALEHVVGYCVGLDMSVRGKQDRSFRKSRDTFTVLGPWLTTADEVPDPGELELWLSLNGVARQSGNTSAMTVGVPRLVELASAQYTLHPGDVLLTGTPEGVGEVTHGDVIVAGAGRLGEMTVPVVGEAT